MQRFVALFLLAFAGCMPAHLAKYQQKGDAPVTASGTSSRSSGIGPDMQSGPAPSNMANDAGKGRPEKATIYAIDKQTYRFAVREDEVWDSVIGVLLRNYNLTIVDRSSGVVTTEWDTFYIKTHVYRNKVSMRVRRMTRDYVEVTVHNSVERLQDGSAAGTVGAVWLPAEDPGSEPVRIIQNMALALNQPPPVVPPEQIAKGTPAAPTTRR